MLIDRIWCIGVNHTTAAVEYREKLGRDITGLCRAAREARVIESASLSTCNRVELYVVQNEPSVPLAPLLATAAGLDIQELASRAHEYRGREAVTHLCRVAAGLNSVVLGEPQILGQVANAIEHAKSNQTAGALLERVFRSAVRAGRRARNETAIGRNPASISSVAVALVREVLGSIRDRRILVIGLGEMGSIAIKALQTRQVNEIAVANRTRARAEEVSARWGYRTYPMEELGRALQWADAVISTTACPHTIVDAAVVGPAMEKRSGRPLVLVDIAVPRDIDPAVSSIPSVHLFDADHLNATLDEGLAARRTEIPKVETIVAEEVSSLERYLRDLEFAKDTDPAPPLDMFRR